ncbi:MAG TPA: MlaD family protein [Verrucomicrobiae bacterium]|jgi:ABC-type transporter Mla subunit MlaD|nr:MlaD family protein [Verrucomicrobiae bacterium]
MALQDLTPQLRTRLNRMERIVGWFVFFATALLLFGFGYYIYHTAERKGWFKIKAPFFTYVQSSAGLSVGDPVYLMGFPVGQITHIQPMPPRDLHNVRIEFEVLDDSFRQLWTGGSFVKINAAGFLNQRQLEVTRGTNGYAIVVTQPVSIHTLDEAKNLMAAAPGDWQLAQDIFDGNSNLLFHAYNRLEYVFAETNAPLLATANLESNSIYIFDNTVNRNRIVASWDGRVHHYKIFQPGEDTAWLRAVETPPISDQLQAMVSQVQSALPAILALTNQLTTVLDNGAQVTSNLNAAIVLAQPVLTNANSLIAHLDTNANSLIENLDTNITATLVNLSDITSNLAVQVQSNSNMLGGISKTILDYDDFVQGLKHHWLLRSAFKSENKKTNAPSKAISPKR